MILGSAVFWSGDFIVARARTQPYDRKNNSNNNNNNNNNTIGRWVAAMDGCRKGGIPAGSLQLSTK